MLARILRFAKQHASRLRAERRCTLAPHAVIYAPELVNAVGGKEHITVGAHTHVRGTLFAALPARLEIGEYCYVGEFSKILAHDRIRIGNRVLIAHNVTIADSRTHPIDPRLRHEHFKAILSSGHVGNEGLGARPIEIEDDAWIACNSVVLRGVRIGRASIVSAGTVVTKDVPPYSLVAGNPGVVVKSLEPVDREDGE